MTRTSFVQSVTASRIVLALVVAGLTVWSGTESWALWVSLLCVVVMELTDLLDGVLARRFEVVTDFGKMFDPFSDAVSRQIVFWSLSVIGLCWLVVPLVLAVRDLTVAYIRVTLTGAGQDVSARITGKIKAWVLALSAILLMFGTLVLGPLPAWVIAAFSSLAILATLGAGVHHLAVAWPHIRARMTA